MKNYSSFLILITLLLLPIIVSSECTCDKDSLDGINKKQAKLYKIIAFFAILAAGAIGFLIPWLGKFFPVFSPENDMFYIIKSFAAGVILATGMVHVLPDAFESLTSPCLPENPWGNFPFAGFVAMVSAMGTLMMDTFATSYFNKLHFKKQNNKGEREGEGGIDDVEKEGGHEGHVHVHTHATHGHSHGSDVGSLIDQSAVDLLRHRVISQVLELGIIVHSVIIGISLGASQNPNTIKPLVAALSFHQLFEGMGLGGCVTQAKFKMTSSIIMAVFFALTTPIGILIGMGVSNIYNESSPKSLIVEGVFNAASAGILVYMALVDLLAADFMSAKMQNNSRLQLTAQFFLLCGAGCMSLLAKWA